MNQPPLPLKIDAYYDSGRKSYLVQDKEGSWMPIEKMDIKNRLILAGARRSRLDSELLPEVDQLILRIQDERHVAYAGPLAGYSCGTHIINGSKVLVTQSPKLITSKPGSWPTIRTLFDNMLGPLAGETTDQRILYYGWLKLCDEQLRKCLEDGICTYGQFIIFAGARGCGKSLCQLLTTEIMGGRSAAPYGYMSGSTPFNRELFTAEHQMIEDEQPHKDHKNRVRFGEAIKQIAARINHPCYGKNREAQSLTPFWRGSLSVNDEPDHLGVLPPFENSLLDKIIILHCRKHPMPMPAATVAEKDAFWKTLLSELPAFLHYLRYEFQIPVEYTDAPENRYGLRPYIHPYISPLVDDMAPETQLLSLIDHCLFDDGAPIWRGTAEEMLRRLSNHTSYGSQTRSVVGNAAWAGRMLGQLAKSKPGRVQEERTANVRNWVVTAPEVSPGKPPTVTLDQQSCLLPI
jgi:hypothetical protein